jgi:hypothetical protein
MILCTRVLLWTRTTQCRNFCRTKATPAKGFLYQSFKQHQSSTQQYDNRLEFLSHAWDFRSQQRDNDKDGLLSQIGAWSDELQKTKIGLHWSEDEKPIARSVLTGKTANAGDTSNTRLWC